MTWKQRARRSVETSTGVADLLPHRSADRRERGRQLGVDPLPACSVGDHGRRLRLPLPGQPDPQCGHRMRGIDSGVLAGSHPVMSNHRPPAKQPSVTRCTGRASSEAPSADHVRARDRIRVAPDSSVTSRSDAPSRSRRCTRSRQVDCSSPVVTRFQSQLGHHEANPGAVGNSAAQLGQLVPGMAGVWQRPAVVSGISPDFLSTADGMLAR